MTEAADPLAAVVRRLDRLESEHAIRGLVTTYFDLCERLDDAASLVSLASLFTSDAVWRGKGARYGAAFGAHEGRDAIVDMLGRYAGPVPHFTLNAHYLGSERIEVAGDAARGRWLMLQTSSYATGGSDLRAARLDLAFERLAGSWRIARFETENILSREIDRWNDHKPIAVPE